MDALRPGVGAPEEEGKPRRVRLLGGAVASLFTSAMIGALVMVPTQRAASVHILVGGASHTLSAGGARVSIADSSTTTIGGRTQQFTGTGEGVVDPRDHRVEITESAPGQGDLELVGVGTVAYFHLPAPLASRFPTPWVSIDLAPLIRSISGSAGLSTTYDPLAGLRLLAQSGIARSVTTVGTDQVRGVETTHYHVVLNAAPLLRAMSANPLVAGIHMDWIRVQRLTADVWIDSSDLVRRHRTDEEYSVAAPGRPSMKFRQSYSEDVYDFGIPVDVQAPPTSQVTPETSLLGLFGR